MLAARGVLNFVDFLHAVTNLVNDKRVDTYDFALEHLLIHLQCLLVNHDKFRGDALTETLGQVLFLRCLAIGVLRERAL